MNSTGAWIGSRRIPRGRRGVRDLRIRRQYDMKGCRSECLACTSWCISRDGAGSGLDPMWLNMSPKSSNSVFSNARSESNSLGGVAVLAVLSVTVLFLCVLTCGGRPTSGEDGDSRVPIPMPEENVLAGLRRKPDLAEGGGTGISLNGLLPALCTFLSDLVSTDEGFVDDVLSRAEEAALS